MLLSNKDTDALGILNLHTQQTQRRFYNILTTLPQRRKIDCIKVISSLEMKVSPNSVGNVVITLKSDVVETFC